ncbi:MAG: hypothetical protein EOR85_33335 [Mesorhizobium sp.]|uniref:hypothetical protein n=1 Tax=Mesorhizobium sp. TaxID=1871066 RepID=UPI000FE5C428|nr:MAG: hypothetical protein EOR79_35100 [Mesorhizobium sp.]RWM89165.1 MAG: hypothetical protein EOR85_33335 [Mesorhizobium sp.]
MYLESVGDPAALRDFACAARDKKVPIVMIKTGRSEVARSITLTHTGAMAGSERYFDTFLQRLGVGRRRRTRRCKAGGTTPWNF